ncbi:glycosyltransferase family 9 protein [Paraburkholderia sartisoli]|uniref:ADP-heptose:LPS heptosyltransferase n=1 Tax=Paraburkholderia sartisoli TaxID=83784 RepID=A0A1H4C3X1_9BURK|nr:glycosyltransferase family 9 protein [Paraburkholderia sartisoli]SEA55044.1 ADP-heptose:LPS heptosyltransferase [Paraburkholderia sartisoli]
MSRLPGRIRVFARALPRLALKPLRRRPARLQRILIAHHLLLGDTLLLTPLIAKLRALYPLAQIVLLCPKPIVPIYAGRPFDVDVMPFDPRDSSTVTAVLGSGPYDLGIVAGDNRFSWIALGAGCRWIVAHDGDVPAWKNWPVDEAVPYPVTPAAWADLTTDLIEGPPPRPFQPADWPAPPYTALPNATAFPDRRYVVLHPGASTGVKRWPQDRWRELAQFVVSLGYVPVWSGGPREVDLIGNIDPDPSHPNLAGQLGLGELWHLYAGAAAIVCPDTGVAHLARIVGVPAVALFGPGNASIHGAGQYWRDAPFVSVTIADMSCRDQPFIFRRKVAWVRRCDRSETTCVALDGNYTDCMNRLSVESVCNALRSVLVKS